MEIKLLIFSLFVFTLFDRFSAQNKYNFDSPVARTNYADPDKYGYRYCANWKLADGTSLYSACDPFSFKRCGQTLEFGYDCCIGFKKIGPPIFETNSFGNQVCGQTIPQWKLCPDVLGLFNNGQFSKVIRAGELANENSAQDFTIFSPESKSENEFSKIYPSTEQSTNNPAFYHVVKGRFHASNLRNNQELESYYQNQKLKVTKYSFGVICIDCVEITKADLECKNGLIHFIRKPLVPRSGTSLNRNNLLDALKSDPEVSSFANDIPPDLQNELRNARSKPWYTVLAVKNDEWDAIKNKYDKDALPAIVRNHIISKLYCSAALYKDMKNLRSTSGEAVSIECATEGNSEVRYVINSDGTKSKFISQDNMAGNGVYHILDKAIVPLSARPFDQILKDQKLASNMKTSKFLDYIKDCDLKMEPGKKYSIFLPMDKSFDWWKQYNQFQPEYNRFLTDKEYRCRVARYHIVPHNPELAKTSSLPHEQKGFKTNNVDLLHQVNYFMKDKDQSELYFHYSKVVDFNSTKFRDGSIYRISKINVIPEKLIVDVLKENPNLKITSNQVGQAKMNSTEFHPRRPLSLFLATLDEGLKDQKTGKPKEAISELDGTSLTNYLLLHTVPLYLWGGDIGYFKKNTIHKFKSRVGLELIFWMDNDQKMKIGYEGLPKDQWAEVVKFNIPAKDGIVWLLKRNLPCPKNICPHKVEVIDYDLFDVYVSACQFMELPGITDINDARKKFSKSPILLAETHASKCAVYSQPTYKVSKKIEA